MKEKVYQWKKLTTMRNVVINRKGKKKGRIGKQGKARKAGKGKEGKEKARKAGKGKARVRWVQFDAAEQHRTEQSKPLSRTEQNAGQNRTSPCTKQCRPSPISKPHAACAIVCVNNT